MPFSFKQNWYTRQDSNLRPSGSKSDFELFLPISQCFRFPANSFIFYIYVNLLFPEISLCFSIYHILEEILEELEENFFNEKRSENAKRMAH